MRTLLASYWTFVSDQPATESDAEFLVGMLDIQEQIAVHQVSDELQCLEALSSKVESFKVMDGGALVSRHLSIAQAIELVCKALNGQLLLSSASTPHRSTQRLTTLTHTMTIMGIGFSRRSIPQRQSARSCQSWSEPICAIYQSSGWPCHEPQEVDLIVCGLVETEEGDQDQEALRLKPRAC